MKRLVVKKEGKFLDVTPVTRGQKQVTSNVLQLMSLNGEGVLEVVQVSIKDAKELKNLANIKPMAMVVVEMEISCYKDEMYCNFIDIKEMAKPA